MLQSLLLASTLLAGAFSAPTGNLVLHEKRTASLPQLRKRVAHDAIIPIKVALRQSNLETGYERLMDVSHPKSANYGKHLSAEEVHEIFAPADESRDLVVDWLISSGVAESSIRHYENRGWIAVDVPASHAESLLSTEYYEHEKDGVSRLGCDEYYLPSHIAEHVDFIKPGVLLSAPMKKRNVARETIEKRSSPPGGPGWGGPPTYPMHHWPKPQPPHHPHLPADLIDCGVNITPPCIKALYDIPNRPRVTNAGNEMGIYEDDSDAFSQTDIDLFFAAFAPYVPQGTTPKVDGIDGGTADVAPGDERNGGESDLDIDLAYSIIYPQKVIVYEEDDLPTAYGIDGRNFTGWLDTFLDAIDGSYCNYTAYGVGPDNTLDPTYPDPAPGGYKGKLQCGTYTLTRVLSASWGQAELSLPKNYEERQCNEFMKLGLQGHSILFASGDFGVGDNPIGPHTNSCVSANGQNNTIYVSQWPPSCPYITSVGGTRLYPNQTVYDRESAMSVNLTAFNIETGEGPTWPTYAYFGSSGGFSNYFEVADYQKAAVEAYLANHDDNPYYYANADASNIGENGGVYNRNGRAFPDVSANGAFLEFYDNATLSIVFGTSLACPIFSSVVTLLNEERTAAGKGPIGFLNPTLYEHPEVLNDIVNGSNPNCGGPGFQAAPGWDPVTGLGTPNYPKMLELFLSLP